MHSELLLRMEDKVLVDDGCWVWVGARNNKGYGSVWIQGRLRTAHRLVYEMMVGPIPEGLQIDHLCRNRACCRPVHLEPVTPQENVRRGLVSVRAGVRNREKTHCPHGHPYTEANTYWEAGKHRRCRTCRSLPQLPRSK